MSMMGPLESTPHHDGVIMEWYFTLVHMCGHEVQIYDP